MVNPIITAVATAISQSFHEEGYIDGLSDPSLWDEFIKAAKLAIAAMKDPSDEDLLAPGEPYQVTGRVLVSREEGIKLRRKAWNKIIDAVLKEEGT